MKLQTLIRVFSRVMWKLRERAEQTLQDVSSASKKFEETADWAGIALGVVAGVAILALFTAIVALERASYER